MTKRHKDNKVGPWAKEKLDSLQACLEYYTTALKNRTYWDKVYIDAFAGPGLSEVRKRPLQEASILDMFAEDPSAEEITYLRGSPRVALDIPTPFDAYVFIERDPERVAELLQLEEEYRGRRRVTVKAGDANEELLAIADKVSKARHRVFAFLDPFGIQMPWSTIEELAKTGAIEVLINFPLFIAINRMLPVTGEFRPGWREALDTFFGTREWEDHVYERRNGMFGPYVEKYIDSNERLLAWYRARLEGAFGYVSPAMLIQNTRQAPLYYLIWAGPNPAGLKVPDYILGKKKRGQRRNGSS